MLNRITMTGRLVADPELRRTQSGVSVTSFRIANDRDYGKGEEKETDFFDVVAWRSTAEFICKYFTKGRMISVDGRLQTRGFHSLHAALHVGLDDQGQLFALAGADLIEQILQRDLLHRRGGLGALLSLALFH